jgi:hypothetical protein
MGPDEAARGVYVGNEDVLCASAHQPDGIEVGRPSKRAGDERSPRTIANDACGGVIVSSTGPREELESRVALEARHEDVPESKPAQRLRTAFPACGTHVETSHQEAMGA